MGDVTATTTTWLRGRVAREGEKPCGESRGSALLRLSVHAAESGLRPKDEKRQEPEDDAVDDEDDPVAEDVGLGGDHPPACTGNSDSLGPEIRHC